MSNPLSTIALLVQNPTTIGSISLDASINETHHSSALITDHPVEVGVNITDHVVVQPDTLEIHGIISNTSLLFPAALPGVALVQSIGNLITGVSNDHAQTSYLALKDLVSGNALVTIVTTLRQYENMLLEDLSVDRNAQYADAIKFTVRAKEVRIISTSSTPLAAQVKPQKITKAAKKGLGTQAPISSTPSAPIRTPTFLGGIVKGIAK